ncbi:MAG: 4Fe-4S binding protein [Candidatus Omnitrophica bacterium]|nr:4Fe-4S binding protein [Candidatus Omnitrophota bacterium]MBU4590353.1 4Fe-4S binding protein [Candidatus Omnitrophota bacterium]
MTEYNIKELKSGGLMKQKEKDIFSLRLRIVGGFVKSEQLIKLSEIADRFGKGYIHLTTRQGIEIPNVNIKDFEKVKKELNEAELQMGACGQRVRTVTACQGKECSHGLIDCLMLAREIDHKYFGIGGHPHKFKIGITGCPNACIKPHENDLGILGRLKKRFVREKCNYCGLCAEICPVGAIEVDKDDEKIVFNAEKCIGCGDCVYSCPTDAWQKRQEGYTIFVGGKMGKFPKLGIKAFDFIETKEKVFEVIEKTLEFYKKFGNKGERFRETLDRVGVEKYKETVS